MKLDKMLAWLRSLTAREIAFGVVALTTTGLFLGMILGKNDFIPTIGAVGSFLAAVFTGVAVVVAWRGFQQSQKTDRQEYRAYVGTRKCDVATFDDEMVCVVEVKNYGRTPAYNVDIHLRGHFPQAGGLVEAISYGNKFTLHPDGEFSEIITGSFIADKGMKEIRASELPIGSETITVYVDVRYEMFSGGGTTTPCSKSMT